ncbi:MAG TPA: anaerobic ribonucleoside-triphosphate reductase activating protein [Gammaproteobacteria bacterium]
MKSAWRDSPLEVGGLTPLTTVDYPGELAAVVFLQGCPWRCGYCHNPQLVERRTDAPLAWPRVIEFLERRRGLLDAVVFSGGEPTLHAGLGEALRQVKSLGFKTALHTAGVYPERLRRILPLLDWVGMDIKSPRACYASITGVRGSAERAWESIELLLESGVECEFRTTLHPDLLDAAELTALADELGERGIGSLVLQKCVTSRCRDSALREVRRALPDAHFLDRLGERFEHFSLRNF